MPVLFSMIAGIAVGYYLPELPGALGVLMAAWLACLVSAVRKRPARLPPLVLFFLLGFWNLQAITAPTYPSHHIIHYTDGRPWHIVGTVKGLPQHLADRTRFILSVESLSRAGKTFTVTGAIRVTVPAAVPWLKDRSRIACMGRVRQIWNFNNPGGFDYRRYMALRGVVASVFVSRKALVVEAPPARSGTRRGFIGHAREAVSDLLDRIGRGDARAVLRALIIGDRSEVSQHTRDVLSRAGCAHLLAISGLHIGLAASFAFFCFRVLLGLSEITLMTGWAWRAAAALSAGPMLFYGFVAGMSPSTERAVIMGMIYLAAVGLSREHDIINTLVVAALLILIARPAALFEVSFQLSFAAVCAIVMLVGKRLQVPSASSPLPRYFKHGVVLLMVSAAAVVGTLPLTLYYFNQASLVAPITNAVMVPVIGFFAIPLGLMAVGMVLFSPNLAAIPLKGALIIVKAALRAAEGVAALPWAAVKTVTPSSLEIVFYYGFAWSILHLKTSRAARAMLVFLVVASTADIAYWRHERFHHNRLRVTVVDVGQGQAVLLELPDGSCMMVDGGGFYKNRFDVGRWVVAPFLWRKKIATVDTLVLSHAHPDHLNGLLYIARHFHVRQLWMNQDVAHTDTFRELMRIAAQKDIRVVHCTNQDPPITRAGVQFEVLYPPPDVVKHKKREPWRTINNNALVLKVCFGGIRFVFPGDIEAEAERELLELGADRLACDVLVVAHHGGATSSTPQFLAAAHPGIAAISVGKNNPLGLPAPSVVHRLQALGCRILRTDQNGALILTTEGGTLRVETCCQ